MPGYSDRVNHAFAFAAKHHDQQVRKGTSLPYFTHPANVAVILTRYAQPEDTVLAGILYDVVEDGVRAGYSRDDLIERIGRKFGVSVLDSILAIARRKVDDDGIELSRDDQKADVLARLSTAGDASRWLCAADAVHNAGSLLADVRRAFEPSMVWNRASGGRVATLEWYHALVGRLDALAWSAPILAELKALVADLAIAPT
jgi:hypothetical protein